MVLAKLVGKFPNGKIFVMIPITAIDKYSPFTIKYHMTTHLIAGQQW